MPKSINIGEFIKRSRISHGDKYDYSKVIYKNQYESIIIICPIHGEFEQIPKSHMNGSGCKKCSYDDSKKRYTGVKKIHRLNKDIIINRLKRIYNYNYDNCEIEGSGNDTIIKNIICPTHGSFNKRLNNHLRQNQGCNICGSNKLNIEEFIKRSNIIHQNKYIYSKSNYKNYKTKIEIECPKHGTFTQNPDKHLTGQGCPDCYSIITSKGESFIKDFLLANNIEFETQKNIPGTKLKFDFYISQKNMFIEYDGIQHYEPRSRFGGEKEYLLQVSRDKLKNEYCERNNIRLLRIGYKDYRNLNSILVDNLLNENKKILKFNNFCINEDVKKDILHIFDFDDTLVYTPSFEEIAIKYLKENLTVKDLLNKSIELINVKIEDLKWENGRIYINDPESKIMVKNNWVRKGNRVYLTSPNLFSYIDESLPNKLKEMSNLYKSVKNKCIVTARPESMRNKIIEKLKELGLEIPKYGIYMKPDNLKNAGEWKGFQICEISEKHGFKNVIFYDDNAKFIKKAKKVVSEKLPNLNFKTIKVN